MGIVTRMVDPFLALEVFESALPDDVRDLMVTHMALADLAWAAQEPQRAADEAMAALQRSPESESAAMRVLEYGLAVEPEQAFAAARGYARNYPQSRQLHLMLVNRYVDYDRHDDALALLREKIGRASCRERGEVAVVGASSEETEENRGGVA